jgi:hypothetical protein
MAVKRLAPRLSTAEVLDRVLDKGIVIEAELRIAVLGLEIVTVNALVRVASFDTWDRYAAARERRAQAAAPEPQPPVAPSGPYRVRLRCANGCTFERRSSALVISDGTVGAQPCAVKPRRRCAVTVL